jgi:hypothetical protein
MPPGNRSVDRQDALANLDGDVEALVFATMMEAAKSAQEDLKTIMAGVKAINAAKRRLRELLCAMNRDVVAATVAELEHRAFAFSPHGLGGDRAYRRVDFPVPDPESSTLSNLLKKISDTGDDITQNIK